VFLPQRKSRDAALERHDSVMTLLVRRYVTAEQRKRDEFGITEDDVMEIRQDISTLRYELIDILKSNGMKTPDVGDKETTRKKVYHSLKETTSLPSLDFASHLLLIV
jgi:hypothetical protein